MAKATMEMHVDDMTCQGCVRSIELKLSGVKGVGYAHVNLGAGTVTVEYDDSAVDVAALIAAVEQIGFHASQT